MLLPSPRLLGKRRRALILACALFAGAALPAFAGFNEAMDAVLAEERLSFASASYLILSEARLIDEGATAEDAARALAARIPGIDANPARTVTLGEYAWYLMKVNGMTGGLMFRVAPGPRYALRELKFLEIVQGRAFTRMPLSGERAARIMGRYLAWKEEKR
jgi:hypothetical protein